ncbi:unnamed protein product [Sphenostylis stenocarpa]|uniref:Uncharacterized protein n=1 Tax=Sphenostylis stenocarpa TaxID=92480 RepID=A0AA86SGD1_9FABA|nr:unnamed protein product [Sphenostylis stenocarpa]
MAIFHATPKCLVIFLALLAFNGALLTHCRKIKPLNQHSLLKEDIAVVQSNVPTPSSEKKKVDSSVIPENGVEGSGDANAFRPTTPGSSPGVGHRKFASEDKDMKATVAVHSSHVKIYVTEGTDSGFKPTNPGHSPGVGHAQQNQIGQ